MRHAKTGFTCFGLMLIFCFVMTKHSKSEKMASMNPSSQVSPKSNTRDSLSTLNPISIAHTSPDEDREIPAGSFLKKPSDALPKIFFAYIKLRRKTLLTARERFEFETSLKDSKLLARAAQLLRFDDWQRDFSWSSIASQIGAVDYFRSTLEDGGGSARYDVFREMDSLLSDWKFLDAETSLNQRRILIGNRVELLLLTFHYFPEAALNLERDLSRDPRVLRILAFARANYAKRVGRG